MDLWCVRITKWCCVLLLFTSLPAGGVWGPRHLEMSGTLVRSQLKQDIFCVETLYLFFFSYCIIGNKRLAVLSWKMPDRLFVFLGTEAWRRAVLCYCLEFVLLPDNHLMQWGFIAFTFTVGYVPPDIHMMSHMFSWTFSLTVVNRFTKEQTYISA